MTAASDGLLENDLLTWLQSWYAAHCDGDWEHGNGIRINTLDNPGWFVRINLEGTELEGRPFKDYQQEVSEDDWLMCRVRGITFEGAGGPGNLGDILRRLRVWAGGEA